jgi:hypothetical protein
VKEPFVRAGKGKPLGGAPKKKRLVPQSPDRRPRPPQHRGSLIALAVIGLLVLGGIGGFAWQMDRQLHGGILRQRDEARRRPDWVKLEALPGYVPAAFRAVVDTTSFRDDATARAPQGEAQLTGDLLRQIHELDGSLGGEARELAMSPLLEEQSSRKDLLELYLNRIYLGRAGNWPLFGVYHASREYFGKAPQQLTVSEAATLAGILLPPRLTDPQNQPGAVGPRRNEVLRSMLESGAIDQAAYRAAIAEPLGFQPGIDYAPMTRPLDWKKPPEVIRQAPASPAPGADSAKTNPIAQ